MSFYYKTKLTGNKGLLMNNAAVKNNHNCFPYRRRTMTSMGVHLMLLAALYACAISETSAISGTDTESQWPQAGSLRRGRLEQKRSRAQETHLVHGRYPSPTGANCF